MTEYDEAVDGEVVPAEGAHGAPAVADDVLPETLHLIPIPKRPFFPGQVQPVFEIRGGDGMHGEPLIPG